MANVCICKNWNIHVDVHTLEKLQNARWEFLWLRYLYIQHANSALRNIYKLPSLPSYSRPDETVQAPSASRSSFLRTRSTWLAPLGSHHLTRSRTPKSPSASKAPNFRCERPRIRLPDSNFSWNYTINPRYSEKYYHLINSVPRLRWSSFPRRRSGDFTHHNCE